MTFDELLKLLDNFGVRLGIWAMQRWMWMIGDATGHHPDWNDEAPLWVLELVVNAIDQQA